jgi:hypothetical protein
MLNDEDTGISLGAWPGLSRRVGYFLGLRDDGIGPCIGFFSRDEADDLPIKLGETAAVGVTALNSCLASNQRAKIAASGSVAALVSGCEMVTDHEICNRPLRGADRITNCFRVAQLSHARPAGGWLFEEED